ncbi:MAG: ScpA family protein [Candidatus Micrarchaeia archaeon]
MRQGMRKGRAWAMRQGMRPEGGVRYKIGGAVFSGMAAGEEMERLEKDSFYSGEDEPKRRARAYEEEGERIDDGEKAPGAANLSGEDMKLEKIVALPTWREMLLDLVATRKLDPWNIDIVEITGSYLERIKKLEMRDLRVPANLILAAAILIRFKSDALRFEEETQVVEEQTYVEEEGEPSVIPVLELKTRVPPRRMVTLDELLVAMERVFDEQKKREEKASRIAIPEVINIQLPEFNMERKMEDVYSRILSHKDSEGLATFSGILGSKAPMETITTLLPLLHLVQDRKVSIFQEKFFGEIFIRVREKEEGKERKKNDGGKGG